MGSANLSFQFSNTAWEDASEDVLIVPVFQASLSASAGKSKSAKAKAPEPKLASSDALKLLNRGLQNMIEASAVEEGFSGDKDTMMMFRKSAGDMVKARRVILVGMGQHGKTTYAHMESGVVAALGKALTLKNIESVAIGLPQHSDFTLSEEAIITAMVDAVYEATYRSLEAINDATTLKKVVLLGSSNGTTAQKKVLANAKSLATARSKTKDLVNMPPNIKRTDTLANEAKSLGKSNLITTKVQANVSWIEKNMPAFHSVALGSLATDPPKFVTMHYKPPGGKPKGRIAIVGKSVIFDTGGYQVKTGNFMNTMKGDMTGGAVVVSIFTALKELKLENIEVLGFMAATPNMIDSYAMVPDSIVGSTCGKFIEIRHTDAEGRLTLIDAVAKACEEKPDSLVTIATLTGAASRAVGRSIALMGRDLDLRQRIYEASVAVGDPVQTLDVTEEDFGNIKSKLDGADIINTSQSVSRGAQSAAAFVMSGATDDVPMAHLDIAGADMTADEKATGIGAKAMVQFLINEDARLAGASKGSAKSSSKASSKSSAKSSKKK